MPQEMGVCANLLNADRQAFIKAMLTKRGESGSTLTVICGQATLSCFAFFQKGRCPMTEAGVLNDPERCPRTKHVDGKSHGWLFWGDDPYIKCDWCGEIRDALTGRVIK